jgi:hypothetical protein
MENYLSQEAMGNIQLETFQVTINDVTSLFFNLNCLNFTTKKSHVSSYRCSFLRRGSGCLLLLLPVVSLLRYGTTGEGHWYNLSSGIVGYS